MAEFASGLDEVNPSCLIGCPSSRQDGPHLAHLGFSRVGLARNSTLFGH